jgi:hypothetical protein
MPNVENQPPSPFRGFRSPNYTPVPDELFDELLVELSGAELKALLYIVRRTFGFKRESDNISLSQMLQGIQTRDGRILDRGVGLSKKTLLLALRSLEDRGIILTKRRQSAEKGNEPTAYCLNVVGSTPGEPTLGGESTLPLGEKVRQGDGGESTPSPRRKNYPIQETVKQNTARQETGEQQTAGSSYFDRFTNLQQRTDSKFSKKRGRIFMSTAELADSHAEPAPTLASTSAGGFTAVSQVLAKRQRTRPTDAPRRSKTAPETADPPQSRVLGQSPTSEGRRGRPPKAPPAIEAYVEQFSSEFHDEDHIPSNVGQAARLWKASGTSEDHFVQVMYEARTITKKRGNIEKRAKDGGEYGVRNRMPYYFSVLRDLLGMKEDQASAGSPSQTG